MNRPNDVSPPLERMSYLIGIDGGGTGTRARLARTDGTLIGEGQAGPSGLGQGIEQAWRHVGQATAAAFGAAGLEMAPPATCGIGLGLAGAHVPERCEAFLKVAPAFAHIALDTDAYTAVLGAHAGRPGAVVAAGTGSVGEALRRHGERVSVGGWGFLIGDEGGGAWLGLRAMREAHRACDGRAPAGPLVHKIWQIAGRDRESLLAWCERAGQHAYAQLAPLIFDTEAADPRSARLLADAVSALESIARALDPAGDLPLAVTGSIGQRLTPRFSAALAARIVSPAGDAADGALQLLRQSLARVAA
jgi:glucosamine kinase